MKRFNGRKTRGGGRNLSSLVGFTLAEVLVTLGIIGVVSAMTVPTLIQNHQRKTYVTQLHKFYNELSQALIQYQTDRNALNLKEAGLISNDALKLFFKSYFNVVNDCGEDAEPCFAPNSNYRKINDSEHIGTLLDYSIAIASGAAITFRSSIRLDTIAILYVDINGPKGPNIAGRDMFAIYIYNDGTVDDWSNDGEKPDKDDRDSNFDSDCYSANNSWTGCFGKILNDNWEMTY